MNSFWTHLVMSRRFQGTIKLCWLAWVSSLLLAAEEPKPTARDPARRDPDIIAIGGNRQLFVDDWVVDSLKNLSRVVHSPTRQDGNPVLRGTEPWEKWTVDVNGHTTLYDDESHQFRMWYVSALISPDSAYGELHRVCYTVSTDGIHWTKPELGQVDWAGSRRNNLIQWGKNWMRRPNVLKDPQDPDPTRRYKMIYSDFIEGRTAIVKAYSIDGIHWRLNGDGQPWFRKQHNSDLLGWDASVQKYVHYVRMPGSPVSVGRSTSEDFVTWSEPQTVIAPKKGETGVNFMGLATFQHEGMYLGLIRVRAHTEKGRWARAYVELASSRDGIRWTRYSPGTPFFKEGDAGGWDSEMVTMSAPIVREGKLWFYFTGQNHAFGKAPLLKVQAGWKENGQQIESAIGLATLRQDGFVSLDAGKEAGIMVTKPLVIPNGSPGGGLSVNAAVRGELRIEILDPKGNVLPGFEASDCRPIKTDALEHAVHWDQKRNLDDESKPSIEALRGKPVRLKFLLRDGSLYSFRFQ
ncbi:MAG: hypothetical protein EXS36_19870 [Pedosphaera sp.]|nr:hypothetical protein [Pedosphaera sp.]